MTIKPPVRRMIPEFKQISIPLKKKWWKFWKKNSNKEVVNTIDHIELNVKIRKEPVSTEHNLYNKDKKVQETKYINHSFTGTTEQVLYHPFTLNPNDLLNSTNQIGFDEIWDDVSGDPSNFIIQRNRKSGAYRKIYNRDINRMKELFKN